MRAKLPALAQALAGQFRAHQPFLVAEQRGHIDYPDEASERVSAAIADRLRPFEAHLVAWAGWPQEPGECGPAPEWPDPQE